MLKRIHGGKQRLETPETLNLWKAKSGYRVVVLRYMQRIVLRTILRVILRIIILGVIPRIIILRMVRIIRRIITRWIVILRNRGRHFERRGDKMISWRSFLVSKNRIFYLLEDMKKVRWFESCSYGWVFKYPMCRRVSESIHTHGLVRWK